MKYLPVVAIFERELEQNPGISELIGEAGYREIIEQFAKTRERLTKIIAKA